jgi:hypothetical protein
MIHIASDRTTKILLGVIAVALWILVLRPLLAPTPAVAGPIPIATTPAGPSAGGAIAATGNSGQYEAFALVNGKVSVIQQVYRGGNPTWQVVAAVDVK